MSKIITEITLIRVQTYLFAVPRLADMIGANALLGEVVRLKLAALATDVGTLTCNNYQLPETDPGDPLSLAINNNNDDFLDEDGNQWKYDNPQYGYKNGVLSRDGGHFKAIFANKDQARKFEIKARQLMQEEIPGLRYELASREIDSNNNLLYSGSNTSSDIAHLPQFQICQESGKDPATEEDTNKSICYSQASKIRKEAYKHFKENNAGDLLSLLKSQLPEFKAPPTDLNELSGKGGYIAVIHADGNRIGQRLKRWQKKFRGDDYLAQEAHTENFFYSMRVSYRRALCDAANEVFKSNNSIIQPYQLLMLGGDDLLLVCQPELALPFIQAFSQALTKYQLIDKEPVSIGAGVVFAKHSIPFNRLHQQAESLATSAKKLFLRCPEGEEHPPERSTVDWLITSNSWSDDPISYRQQHEILSYPNNENGCTTLALTARPYYVLSDNNNNNNNNNNKNWSSCLEHLLTKAEDINASPESVAMRSQLKKFVTELNRGKQWSSFCYDQFPTTIRDFLKLYLEINNGDELWTSFGNSCYLTHFKDLIELLELPLMGRRTQLNTGQTHD